MLQPHKPDTPSATPIRKSRFRKHRKKFDHAPVNFNKNTGPHHGINIVRLVYLCNFRKHWKYCDFVIRFH